MWAAQGLRLSPGQTVHYSGSMSAMGFSFPTALGIALQSGVKTIVVTGDGSMQFNIQELDSLKRMNLDVTVIVMNNAVLGKVKNFQDMYFDGRNQSTPKGYSNPTFAEIAAAYGVTAQRIANAVDMERTLPLIAGRKGPLMMEGAMECRPRLAFGSKLDEPYPKLDA